MDLHLPIIWSTATDELFEFGNLISKRLAVDVVDLLDDALVSRVIAGLQPDGFSTASVPSSPHSSPTTTAAAILNS